MASKQGRDVKRSEDIKGTLKVQSAEIACEEFAVMLSKLLTLLSAKYSKPEELQQLLIKCMRLTVTSDTPYIFLINNEQKMKFGTLNNTHDMFMFFQSYWSWCDFDLLKCIVKLSNVAEASQLLETYDYMTDWKIDLKKEESMVISSQVMPYHFCKVVVVIDESCDQLSKSHYRDLKNKLLDLGSLQNFCVFFNGEAFKPLLKLYVYILINTAESMIRALQPSKLELLEEGFVYIKVGETLLFDTRSSQSKKLLDIKQENQIYKNGNHSRAGDDLSVPQSFSLIDVEAKVVMLGALGVGKTSITLRYIGNLFSPDVSPTIAASFFSFTVNVGQSRVKFQLWDTAGHERFRSMLPMYYRRANAAIIVYDVTSEGSFAQVTEWIDELRKNVFSEIALCIVGNKTDLQGRVKVPTEKGQRLANSHNAAFVESSAKQNIGIEGIFCKTAMQIVDLKQKKLQENMIPVDGIQFANFPSQPYVVVGHRPIAPEPITVPPKKPKRKCCPW